MVKDSPQLPIKLFKDTSYQQQPEGTYPFALNAVNNFEDGSRNSLVNEKGNYLYLDLPGNYCGRIIVNRFKSVIFTSDGSISLLDTTNSQPVLTILVAIPEFNFSTNNPITGEHRIIRGCENVIYWRDGVNPDRYFNYDKPNDFQVNGVFDINQFGFIKNYKHPIIDTEVLGSNGNTDYGSYFFSIDYVDNRGNTLFTSPLSIKYTVISGGFNIDNQQVEVGGRPKSNSSIVVSINNLSTDYEYIRLNVLISRSGNGVSYFAHTVGALIPVSGELITYIYSGFNPDAGDYQIDANSLLVDKAVYVSSMAMEQVDNRLIRGNLLEAYRDYASYQQYASKICTKYVVEQDTIGCRTELGGEVKAYGIVYVFADGSTSPVFHIPGPKIENYVGYNDRQLNIYALELPGIPCSDPATYEITVTINGVQETFTGVAIGRTPVTTFSGDITIDNFIAQTTCVLSVTYAIEDADPESFTWANISEAQRTSSFPNIEGTMGGYYSDQLYKNPTNYCGTDFWGLDCDGDPLIDTNIRYHYLPDRATEPLLSSALQELQPGVKYNKIGVKFDNIEYPDDNIVGHYFVTNIRTSDNSLIIDKGLFFQWWGSDDNKKARILDYDQEDSPREFYGFISPENTFGGKYFEGDYALIESLPFFNSDVDGAYDSPDFFDKSDLEFKQLSLYAKHHELTAMTVANRELITIKNTHAISPNSYVTIDAQKVENYSKSSKFMVLGTNNSEITNTNKVLFGALKKQGLIFRNLYSINYRRITELNENVSFNGDAFVSQYDFTNISWFSIENKWFLANALGEQDPAKYEFEYFQNIISESVVNTGLRHQGNTICNNYFDLFIDSIYEWFIGKIVDKIDGKNYLKQSECLEWYGYNKDMSVINAFNKYFNLPILWDYCSTCTNKYPNRIVFSQKSLSEQLEDNFLVNLANDYVDIPADTGAIMGIDYKDGKLIVRTEYSCYFLQPNPQQLSTTESTVYIGTGDFLSIPPLELNAEETGYGGQQHVLESINTEHGFIWIDRQKGKVFKFANGLEEISRAGLQYWFLTNLPGSSYCVLTYDFKYERLIITKRNSWTISYDFMTKSWISYHSYIPSFYMYDGRTFYSIIGDKLWKHGVFNTFHNFFGIQYPYIVEFVVKDFMNFDAQSVQYYAVASRYVNGQWIKSPEITFDEMWAYNDFQSTGLMTLELDRGYDNIYYYLNKKHVKLTDDTYKINNIKATNKTHNIASGDDPNKQPLPIEAQNQYDVVPMSGKFLVVRLFLNNPAYKMVTYLINTVKKYNIR